jgi:hypothetical protein
MAGDLATAAAALDELGADGGADDANILLARGKFAFFTATSTPPGSRRSRRSG